MTELLLFFDESTETSQGPDGPLTVRQLYRYDTLAAEVTRRGIATDVTEDVGRVERHDGWVLVHGPELLASTVGTVIRRPGHVIAANLPRRELVETLEAGAVAAAIGLVSLRRWDDPTSDAYGRAEVVASHRGLDADGSPGIGGYVAFRAANPTSLADALALYLTALRGHGDALS